MADFLLSVATPERVVADERATEAQIPCKGGFIGVLPQHAPLLSELEKGILSWSSGAGTKRVSLGGGFVEVLGDRVRILADSAETVESSPGR